MHYNKFKGITRYLASAIWLGYKPNHNYEMPSNNHAILHL